MGSDVSIASGFLVAQAPADLSVRLLDHLPVAEACASRNVERAQPHVRKVVQETQGLLDSALAAGSSRTSKVMMIRHVASRWSAAVTPFSACRHGCAHCCHIAVSVPEVEAKLIAAKTGRRLQRPLRPRSLADGADEHDYGYDDPCVFLEGGRCSIYEHRPLACRTLVNMDDSAVLCELQQGMSVPVPYGNAIDMQGRFALVTQMETFADIRDWFRL
ncbi:hypothetical protein BN948_05053 [Hydrogenophaga intermedia]|uniref:Flagellin N-methylase n=1 Tax=Hydrogenophaga intermedia TaxID=65786 RepID=A0A1L1PL33_HYDIT|nr:hypothetical protein BN948_05053 [Hydrogenophaga intermedia]